MPASDTLRRVPRFPHVGVWCLVASQALVAWLWVRFGWQVGLPAMVASLDAVERRVTTMFHHWK